MKLLGIAVLIYLAVVSYIYVFSPSPISYPNVPFPVSPTTYHPGDTIQMTVTRCSSFSSDVTYDFSRLLVRSDGLVFATPSGSSVITPGCRTLTSMLNVLPDNLPPGTWVLHGATTVREVFRSYEIGWQSQPFTVVSR